MTFPRTVVTLFYHKSALFSTEKGQAMLSSPYNYQDFFLGPKL